MLWTCSKYGWRSARRRRLAFTSVDMATSIAMPLRTPTRVSAAATRGKALGPLAEGGQRAAEQGGVVEGVQRVAGAAGDERQSTDPPGMEAVELERELHAHAVADDDGAPHPRGVEDGGEVVRELWDGGGHARRRQRRPAVPAVVPVEDPVVLGQRGEEVLPGEAVAGQSVAEDQGGPAPSLDLHVDLGAIRSCDAERPSGGRRGHGVATHRAIV
jgi:hypothetical protein